MKRVLIMAAAVTLGLAALAGCSSDDDSSTDTDDATTTTAESGTGTTVADDADVEDADGTDDESDEEEGEELSTRGLLDFLNDNYGDETWVAEFDWDVGDGTIGMTFVGATNVQLVAAGDLDVADAIAACEAASDYVFEIEEGASISVITNGLGGETIVVRETVDGECAEA